MKFTRQTFFCIALIAMTAIVFTSSARAASITYVFTGTATGTLGACEICTSFTNQTLTITITADTSNVTFDNVATYRNQVLTTTITISGIPGSVTVTPGNGNYDYIYDLTDLVGGGNIGYGLNTLNNGDCPCDIIAILNPAYATYNLEGPIGAVLPAQALATGDFSNVPTSGGPLTVSSFTGTFSAVLNTSSTQTLEPGVQTIYSFDNGDNKVKITPSQYSMGGESLTVTEVPILKTAFIPPSNFSTETCPQVADYTAANGADTCIDYQFDCSVGGVAGGGDCNTLLYTLIVSYDLAPDLPAETGPDFLVVHGSGCPTSSGAVAQSIFTDYYVSRIDPSTKGSGAGTGSCFEVTYTPGAPALTNSTTSRFVGWQSPVVDTDLNQVKAGSTTPLIFSWSDSSGNPITNLSYCNAFTITNSGNVCNDTTVPTPWVNLSSFGVPCQAGAQVNSSTDDTTIPVAGGSGFQNQGNGNYQMNWKTQKSWKGSCADVQVTFDNGVFELPAVLGFQFN